MNYYESPAYGEWCRRSYGMDMKQMGMVTKDELELFYREVNLTPNAKILDIGCGPGYFTAAIAEHYQAAAIGIDIDAEAIRHAKELFCGDNAPQFLVADGNTVVYPDGSFDLICLFDTLYFTMTVEKLRLLMDKCERMLKAGGKIAVFWTNQKKDIEIFKMQGTTAGKAQVGLWASDRGIKFRSFDLTEDHRRFWIHAASEYEALTERLAAEIPELYQKISAECAYFFEQCKKGDDGGIFRWLFLFEKNALG